MSSQLHATAIVATPSTLTWVADFPVALVCELKLCESQFCRGWFTRQIGSAATLCPRCRREVVEQ